MKSIMAEIYEKEIDELQALLPLAERGCAEEIAETFHVGKAVDYVSAMESVRKASKAIDAVEALRARIKDVQRRLTAEQAGGAI